MTTRHVTTTSSQPRTTSPDLLPADVTVRPRPPGSRILGWITTTDHKVIGNLYLMTSFGFFMVGGLLAMIMRLELMAPGLQVLTNLEQFNALFTMHGSIMLLLFATPLFAGFANALVPLQIGAADMAFPRLNMFAYWMYLFGGLVTISGFLVPGGAASFGWFAYIPLSNNTFTPGLGPTCGCWASPVPDSARSWVR